MPSPSVSSVEFQKAFSRYREVAQQTPVTITDHGRDSLVLMGIDEYRRLKSRDRVALKVEDLSDEDFRALTEQDLPVELARYDDEISPNL